AARAAPRAAAEEPRRADAVAAVAAEVPPELRDGRGEERAEGRAGLFGDDDRLRRRRLARGRGASDRARSARAAVRAGRGHRAGAAGAAGAPGDGISVPRAAAARAA